MAGANPLLHPYSAGPTPMAPTHKDPRFGTGLSWSALNAESLVGPRHRFGALLWLGQCPRRGPSETEITAWEVHSGPFRGMAAS